jgi:high affinity sulfate transporter 1
MPGLPVFVHYRREDFPADLRAGMTVAAVALPVAVAYAQMAGFSPAVGLYASMLPLLAYALFGSSRQLILGPDAATCAMVSSALIPLAGSNPDTYLTLSALLAFFAGMFCLLAGRLRLGLLADFLSRPILVGFLNGVALSIFIGQSGKLLGFSIESHTILPRLAEIAHKLPQTHLPTLAIGLATFAVMALSNRLFNKLPAALIAMIVSSALVAAMGLQHQGVTTLGLVPAGLPTLRLDFSGVSAYDMGRLLTAAVGVALISFSNAILVARGFAAKDGAQIDSDLELRALGAANIAAAFSGSFAISAADSRTAINQSAGGHTQMVSLITAASIALSLLFLTDTLQFVPMAALGAILIHAAIKLIDFAALRELHLISRGELSLALITTLGVVTTGVMEGIAIAVGLSLLRFIHTMARPEDEILGRIPGQPGFHNHQRHPDAKLEPGVLIYRFNAPLVFFNAPYFKHRALQACHAQTGTSWMIIDMLPLTRLDATGLHTLNELKHELRQRGIHLVMAGRRTELLQWQLAHEAQEWASADHLYLTLKQALHAYQTANTTMPTTSHAEH